MMKRTYNNNINKHVQKTSPLILTSKDATSQGSPSKTISGNNNNNKRKQKQKSSSRIIQSIWFVGITLLAACIMLYYISLDYITILPIIQQEEIKQQHQQQEKEQQQETIIRSSSSLEESSSTNQIIQPAKSMNDIISTLLELSRKYSTIELRDLLNTTKGDYFQLTKLEKGVCPYSSSSSPKEESAVIINWLPNKTSSFTSNLFKSRHNNNNNLPKEEQQSSSSIRTIKPIIWYEHLSKAGGTSFCKLAQSNMKKNEVPRYYCMPSKNGLSDGRVGRWNNNDLISYMSQQNSRAGQSSYYLNPINMI